MHLLPRGRLVAIDRSWNMLLTARANLRPEFGDRVSFARVELPHAAVQRLGGSGIQHRHVPLGARSPALFDEILRCASTGRTTVRTVWRRPEPRTRRIVWQRRSCGARRLLNIFSIGRACGSFRRRRVSGTSELGRLRGHQDQPRARAHDARRRSLISRVRDDRHLQPAPGAAARGPLRAQFIDEITATGGAPGSAVSRSITGGSTSKECVREPPNCRPPSRHAVYSPEKMGKSTIFESPRLLVGLNAFEPGQAHALHAHAGQDKVYSGRRG